MFSIPNLVFLGLCIMTSLFILLSFSSFFGLAPFVSSAGVFSISWPKCVHSAAVGCILTFLAILIYLDSSGTTNLAQAMSYDVIDTYGFTFSCLGTFYAHLWQTQKIQHVLNHMLQLLSQPYVARFPFTNCKKILIYIVCGFIYEIVFASFSLFVVPFDHLNFTYYVIETLTYVALEMVSYVVFLQFIFIVRLCWLLFSEINVQLYIMGKELQLCSSKKQCRFKLIRRLRKLRLDHADIAALCRKVNDAYSIQNLLNLTLCFIEITYSIYVAIVETFQSSTFGVTIDTLLWTGYFICKLLYTLFSCSFAVHEAKRTATLLNKLLEYSEDDTFTYEVEVFSLQLLHDEVHFDAFGFFPLDFTLLYSMIASVVGYLVILVQTYDVQKD